MAKVERNALVQLEKNQSDNIKVSIAYNHPQSNNSNLNNINIGVGSMQLLEDNTEDDDD